MTELTELTARHVRAMFVASDVERVQHLLVSGCGQRLPGLSSAESAQIERIQSAAVRVSAGRMDALLAAMALAAVDWRDLLVAAGFADDPAAHTLWHPRRLDAETLNEWYTGLTVEGVAFSLNDSVQITSQSRVQTGSIISLEALEPEPRYLVGLGTGGDVLAHQHDLERLGSTRGTPRPSDPLW